MNKVIPFELGQDMLNQRVFLTPMGVEAARMYRPPRSPQTWGEVKPKLTVDPENPPVGGPPEWIGWEDVEIEPSEDDEVVAVVCVVVRGKRKSIAKVWEDGLVDVFPMAFGADDGDIFLRGLRVAHELVGGGMCVS